MLLYIIFFFFFSFISLFILALLGLRCCLGFPLGALSRGLPLAQCAGFSLQWLSLCGAQALGQAGFSSCGTWAL